MGGRPVPGRPLPLLDDPLEGPVGARQVGDGPKVRPAEGGLVGLLERRADEQPVLAQLVSVLQRSVAFTERGQRGDPPDLRAAVPGRPQIHRLSDKRALTRLGVAVVRDASGNARSLDRLVAGRARGHFDPRMARCLVSRLGLVRLGGDQA